MKIKNNNKKTSCTKNKKSVALVPAKEVAELLGISESTVKKVRTGKRTDETLIGKKVQVFDELYRAGESLLIKEVSRIVKF